MSAILRYYQGATDDRGRRLEEILDWPDERLEAVHDFIQWMFPLAERSGANPGAPVLDDETVRAFQSQPELQARLRVSFVRMLGFYGLELTTGPEVRRAANFSERSREWLTRWNHNHLRITRILKSLRILGLAGESRAFFHCLDEIYGDYGAVISPETFEYWRSAATKSGG
jgi:hypothetical protein